MSFGSFGSKTPVSVLQEYLVAKQLTPSYELIWNGVGTHNPKFIYRVHADGTSADGEGSSKQEAKHNAAQAAIDIITRQDPSTRILKEAAQHAALPQEDVITFNAVGNLSDYCIEKNYPDPIYQLVRDEGEPHEKIFSFQCNVSQLSELGTARTKKQAKQKAAYAMLLRLKSQSGDEYHAVALKDAPAPSTTAPPRRHNAMSDAEVNEKFLELTQTKRMPTNSMYISDLHRSCINFMVKSETLRKFVENEPNEITNYYSILTQISKELCITLVTYDFPENGPIISFIAFPIAPCITGSGNSLEEAAKKILGTYSRFVCKEFVSS